ncbi:MAG TPA: DPP IV N-terminal domain-containing protein [Thermoanaerobaculia bacterium]
MRTTLAALALLVAGTLNAQPMLSQPSLSPDGKSIAFVSGDDIWIAPAGGGDAHILIAHPASESRPLFSPDGRSLAFVSTRSGNGDIYVADLATGATRRITWDDARDSLDAWSHDGKWLYFTSNSREADSGSSDVWRVAATGGTPMQVTAEKMSYEYYAAPSPDGKSVAFVARGFAYGQWWRHGRSHMDESQLALVDFAHHYEPLTQGGSKDLWPMWSPDGKRVYFTSDRDGNENLWVLNVSRESGVVSREGGSTHDSPLTTHEQQLTNFKEGRLLWPSISADGKTIVFERKFGIWKADTATGHAVPVAIALQGVASSPNVEHRKITDHLGDLALSPDGKKVVFTARGDVFAASAKEPGDGMRVTNTEGFEMQPAWSGDSRSVFYVSDRDGHDHLYRYDFATDKETQLTTGDSTDVGPRVSPDGKMIAFARNENELVVLDLANNQTHSVAKGHFDRPPYLSDRPIDWSPDSKWIAYLTGGEGNAGPFVNAWVVPAAGGAQPRAVSFIANGQVDSLTWSRDGKFLLIVTGQRTEQSQIARIDLVPQTPKLREEEFRELFKTEEKLKEETKPAADKEKEKKAPPAVTVDFTGIRDRSRILPIAFDTGELTISPDGKWLAFSANVGDDQNVYVYSIDELASEPAVPKQISATSGRKHNLQFSPDSKEVWYLDDGKVVAATIDPAKTRPVAVSAEMDVDFDREKKEAFRQAWTWEGDNFFDAKMNGADWAAIRAEFEPRVAAARNGDEFRRLLQLMVGELNASHLGAAPPQGSVRTTTGRIGVRFDRDEYESHGALKVSEIIPLGPADVAKIKVGDYLVAVDGTPVTASTNFDALLDYKIGKRTVIAVASAADGTGRRDVVLQPISIRAEQPLTYRGWVYANRDYVNRISNGRLGYVHMYDMSWESLQRLFLDLDAENRTHDGVVIDLRNNHGGFVNPYAIDVFARRSYLTMVGRDFPPSPARSILGQRALERPTVLVINRHSLSDAEDFTEGYRALKLGKVVGEPTAGWIIYTSNFPLLDGTSFRLPSIRVLDAEGKDMEMHPRPVDRLVIRPIGESYAGKDSQLDAAVEELVKQLK